MSTLGEAIAQLFPSAVHGVDFRVDDRGDGQGARITFWSVAKLGVQPTQATIDQAKLDVDAARAAATTTRNQENTVLAAALTKLGNGNDLTAAELRAVLGIMIRRQNALQTQLLQTLR